MAPIMSEFTRIEIDEHANVNIQIKKIRVKKSLPGITVFLVVVNVKQFP